MARIVHLPKGAGGGTLLEAVPPTSLGALAGPTHGSHFSRQVPPIGWVRLEAEDDAKLTLLAPLGEGNLDTAAGVGPWTETPRPGRRAAIRWPGNANVRIPVTVFIDRLADGLSVEEELKVLLALGGRGPKGNGDIEPPHLIFDTAGASNWDYQAYPDQRWVIDSLTWGDQVVFNEHGNRVRQDATVTLLPYVSDQLVADKSLAIRRQRHPGKLLIKDRTYRVKKGDTLVSIAARKLGSPDRWLELARLNHLRGGEKLKAGITIRLR